MERPVPWVGAQAAATSCQSVEHLGLHTLASPSWVSPALPADSWTISSGFLFASQLSADSCLGAVRGPLSPAGPHPP